MILKYLVVTVFLKILSISCDKQYGSLTFVIDTTGSMSPEIDIVTDAAKNIMDIILYKESSQIKDVVLVTFNDPDFHDDKHDMSTKVILKESRNINEVKNTLTNLEVYAGGGDCVEYSLSGIKMGLSESRRNSYLFVFTDAPPKEVHDCHYENGKWKRTLNEAKLAKELADVNKLAQSRGSPVFFFLTPGLCQNDESFKVYQIISSATNGQVFTLEQKDDVKVLLPFLEAIISGSVDTITRKVIEPHQWGTVSFTVDDYTEYVIISASSSGDKVQMQVSKPTNSLNTHYIAKTNNNKVLQINSPPPGEYEVRVRGSSETTVMVFGRTDFNFQHGFSERVPPTFRNDKLQPTDGVKSSLLIKINDPTQSVDIKTAQIVSADGNTVYYSLPLKKQSRNYYSTDSFLPPLSMFLISVIGEGKVTHKEIKRTAKTPIQSRPRDTDPEISIQGGGRYTYNSKVLLTCKVKAFPQPSITWKDDKGNILPSVSIQKIDTYNYISKIYVNNLTHKGAYYCQAQVGINENSERVDLDVTSPFIVNEDASKAPITVEFESSVELKCNIKSNFRMEIVWYHVLGEHREILNNSATHHISRDRTQMIVNKVRQDDEGKYICDARIQNDKDTTYQIEKEIKIKHVAPLMGKSDKIDINENASVNIKCNIMKAYPKPKVLWMFRDIKSNVFRSLNKEGEVLEINAASIGSAGEYKCVAYNDMGSNSHETTVTVLIKPKIRLLVNNEEKSAVIVEYNSYLQFTCHVISHSSPDIVWKKDKEEILKADRTINLGHNEYKSYLTIRQTRRSGVYYCEAKNELATERNGVQVQVKSPFQVSTQNKFAQVEYGDDLTINCGITSHLPINITWTRVTGNKITALDKYFVSSDGKVIQIKNAKLDSKGKYICKASIADDESIQESHETIVDVIVEKPRIHKQPDVTIRRNETAELNCRITKGLPKPTITWMVMKEKMSEFTVLPEAGEILTVPYAQYYDTGSYKCRAENDIGIDEQTVKLVVEGPPIIISDEDKLYTALEGDVSLRIPCVTDGYPKPVINWTTGSKTNSAHKFHMDTDGTFVLKNPQKEDSGNYICKATNKFGTVEKTFEGLVMEYVDLDQDGDSVGNITFVDILESKTKKLDCGSGSLKGRWYKEGYPTNKTGVLTIEDASLSDEGNYTCRVSDMTGSNSHTYIVVVGNPPVFEDPDNENLENWKGDAQPLSCAVSMFMRPNERTAKAEWTYNGKPSHLATGGFVQSQHPIVSWGQYTCTISNVHDSVTKHFNVHSTGCLMHLNSTVSRSPLVLDSTGNWPKLTIKQQYIYIPHNQAVLLTCHNESKPNSFEKIPKKSELLATCDHEDNFSVEDSTYNLFDLKCNTEVDPVIKRTGEKCFYENTEIIKVGYNVKTPDPHFLEVYSVCFDNSKKVAMYSKVHSTQTNRIRLENASWKNLGYHNEKTEKFCVDGSDCCLNQRPLVDEMDVASGPAQWATFIEGLNTVPYWKGCENIYDTLDEFDSLVRSHISKPYDFVSGAFNYVDNNGIMVPRYLFKMVRKSASSLVYVRVNDPHPTAEDILCQETRCPGWIPKQQYSYCCRLSEFQNILPGVID